MKSAVIKFALILAAIAASTVSAVSLAGDDRDRRDRIIGLWDTDALVGPCNGTPTLPIRNTLLFHAGGTLIEAPRIGPSGVPTAAGIYQRGQALGTWVYDHSKRRFYIHLRFDNYVNNVYDGYSTVDREMTLMNRGMTASGPVRSTRYFLDARAPMEVCGQATSTPL